MSQQEVKGVDLEKIQVNYKHLKNTFLQEENEEDLVKFNKILGKLKNYSYIHV